MRDALIKLFDEPVPESYKAGREVLHSILGRNDIPADKPVLSFFFNQHLSSLAKPGVTPVVSETKGRLTAGCKLVVATIESAGQEQFMDFISILMRWWWTFGSRTVWFVNKSAGQPQFNHVYGTHRVHASTYFRIFEL
jgi:hypothetical protein